MAVALVRPASAQPRLLAEPVASMVSTAPTTASVVVVAQAALAELDRPAATEGAGQVPQPVAVAAEARQHLEERVAEELQPQVVTAVAPVGEQGEQGQASSVVSVQLQAVVVAADLARPPVQHPAVLAMMITTTAVVELVVLATTAP
jgi:hypothetical protein